MMFYAICLNGGHSHLIRARSPRKWLMDYYCKSSAKPIFQDRAEGGVIRVGWIIGGQWFHVYRMTEMDGSEA